MLRAWQRAARRAAAAEPAVRGLTELRGPGWSQGPGHSHSRGRDSCAEGRLPNPVSCVSGHPGSALGPRLRPRDGRSPRSDSTSRLQTEDEHSVPGDPVDLAGAATLCPAWVSQGPAVLRGLPKHQMQFIKKSFVKY